MANPKHIKVVLQGAEAIAEWRTRNPGVVLDLSGATLRRAQLEHSDLRGAQLSNADLEWADLRWVDLIEADLRGAKLKRADLHKADLQDADLSKADLSHANLEDASLISAAINKAIFNRTRLINTDFSEAIGTKTAKHDGPSQIDQETIAKSTGLSAEFLRGCGLYAAHQAVAYRAIVASPGDLAAERQAARDTIYQWNDHNAHRHGAVLLPVLWETHAVPELGDGPQPIINRQLIETSQILVGIFWTRIGTPTGKAESGTVEEILRFMAAKKPALLYFCSRPIPKDANQAQLNRLKKFQAQIRKKGLIAEFKTTKDLQDKMSKHLTAVIEKLHSGNR
jgi:hypothetical protein